MTGQSLHYMGEMDLKHKVLAIPQARVVGPAVSGPPPLTLVPTPKPFTT